MVKRWNLAHNLNRKGLIVPQLRRQVCFSSCDPVENALQWSVTDRNGDHASNIRQQVGFTWNPDPTGVYISCEVLEIGFEPDKPNEVLYALPPCLIGPCTASLHRQLHEAFIIVWLQPNAQWQHPHATSTTEVKFNVPLF